MEDAMDLICQLTDMARAGGASLAGVASVDRFDGAPKGHHPRELLPGARSVFTFGIRILDRVLEWPDLLLGSPLIPEGVRLEALHAHFYKCSGYDIINDRLNHIALRLADHLEDLGYPSLFFPATYGALSEKMARLPGMFSQRHAAVRAGLGEFGLNNVVVTARYGPRIRFNSVITAAPLAPSPPLQAKTCLGADCNICVDACPAGAFRVLPEGTTGRIWLDPVSRTDWSACRKSQAAAACMGHCLRVCPTGRNDSGQVRPHPPGPPQRGRRVGPSES
jgi:epoxyqueuosine reductase QueG